MPQGFTSQLVMSPDIHTCPPDAPARLAYQRTLMNPYCIFDLHRPRHRQGNQGRCPFPVTRLWSPFTDALKVFQKHNASQPRCAQKVWEALLTAFPLDHKRMQTALLARELTRMMRWDGDTTRAINLHFNSIAELHHTLNFIGDLSMEDVLQPVLLATLRASPNASLRAAYHAVIDAVDDDKELTFPLIQDGRRSTLGPVFSIQ